MIRNMYDKFIGTKFLNKIFLTYFAILLSALTVLAFTVSNNINGTLQINQIEYNRTILYNLNDYFEEKYRVALTISSIIYHDGYSTSNGSEVINFLENSLNKLSPEYLALKTNFDRYFDEMFSRDKDIFNILVYQKRTSELYLFTKNSRIHMDLNDFHDLERIKQSDKPYANLQIFPTFEPDYAKGERVYTLSAPIKSLTDLSKNIGVLSVDFRVASIESTLAYYTRNFKGTIVVLTQSGEIIYDSSEKFYGQKFPYLSALKAVQTSAVIDGQDSLVNTIIDNSSGLLIATIVPNRKILESTINTNRTIYLITFLCTMVGLLLTFTSTFIFSKRIKTITSFMTNVRLGNLSERIPDITSFDEIGQIALSFNRMTTDLQDHINRVYLSEIKQKNAELTALQAQVNPHFLYNTLEVIRMKADMSGDNGVSDMIYLLAKLFKNTIKQEHIIFLEDEINNSRLYLELFRIRYGDKLQVSIQVEEDTGNFGIVKYTLQPIIENYIIHGFDKDRSDNIISIRSKRQENDLFLIISDNGLGIPEDELTDIRQKLSSFRLNSDNIGLMNVNERIKIIYGSQCGLEVASEMGKGTTVTVKINSKTKKELEEYVQGLGS